MTDIVVCVPQTREGKANFYSKVADIGYAFWTMGRTPKTLKRHDWIWFVNRKRVEYGVEIKEIERGPLEAIEDAYGYNPPVPKNGCRLHFFDSIGAQCWTQDDSDFPYIPSKGFQGFRYKWWEWDWEKEDIQSLDGRVIK